LFIPVQVEVPHLSTISGADLPATYKAVQFHLHWGNKGGPGSEHTIDGEQYPMEVTHNSQLVYPSIYFQYLFNPTWGRKGVGALPSCCWFVT